MFSYTAYGLGIHSMLELPELVKRESPADAVIRMGSVDNTQPADSGGADWIWATHDTACLSFEEAGKYLVRGGNEITIDMPANADPGLIRVMLLGPVMSLLLHQRGFLLLHASSVAIDGGAVAFVAVKGMGKSTLAATLLRSGYDIISDDIVAIELKPNMPPMVYPAFPQLKLWPDAVRSLGEDPESMPTINTYMDKRSRRIEHIADKSMPLRAVYVLEEGGDRQAVEPLKGMAAFQEICNHSYVLAMLGATQKLAYHFEQSTALIKQVPVRRLLRKRQHDALPELVKLIVNDVTGKPA